VVWQRTFGGPGHDWAMAMQGGETPDGGLAVAGSTRGAGSEGWILRLAADGTVRFDPASGYRSADTAAMPVRTGAQARRLVLTAGIPDFPPVPYPAAWRDPGLGVSRQAP